MRDQPDRECLDWPTQSLRNAQDGQAQGDARPRLAPRRPQLPPRGTSWRNCDIKDLLRGSKIYSRFVPGGVSFDGRLHFSQGDGEITLAGHQMAGGCTLKVDVIKKRSPKYGIRTPVQAVASRRTKGYLIFEGISVDEAGSSIPRGRAIAYRQALIERESNIERSGAFRARRPFEPGQTRQDTCQGKSPASSTCRTPATTAVAADGPYSTATSCRSRPA